MSDHDLATQVAETPMNYMPFRHILIVGESGSGKSALAVNISRHLSARFPQLKVLIYHSWYKFWPKQRGEFIILCSETEDIPGKPRNVTVYKMLPEFRIECDGKEYSPISLPETIQFTQRTTCVTCNQIILEDTWNTLGGQQWHPLCTPPHATNIAVFVNRSPVGVTEGSHLPTGC